MLTLLAQLVAVTTASLPLVGYAARAVAFTLDSRIGSLNALHVAGAAPLVDLAVTGLSTSVFAAIAYMYAYSVAEKPKAPESAAALPTNPPAATMAAEAPAVPTPRRRSKKLVLGVLVLLGVASVMSLMIALFAPVTMALLFLVAYVVAARWLERIWRQRHSLRVAWVWPVLVACLVLGAVDNGVYFTDAPAGNYTLNPTAGTQSGWYVQIGESGDTVYLLSCQGSAGVIALPQTAILRVDYATRSQIQAVTQTIPSLFDLVTGQAAQPAGLQMRCP